MSNSLLFSQDYTTDLSAFHQALVSATTKPMPILKAVMSLISFARNPVCSTLSTMFSCRNKWELLTA